jgi:hypothetical protein
VPQDRLFFDSAGSAERLEAELTQEAEDRQAAAALPFGSTSAV